MTRDERSILDVFLGEFRQFRNHDTVWKAAQDKRLRVVEEYVAAEKAKDEEVVRQGISRRAQLGILASAIGVTASTVLGIVNLFVR